ASMVIVTLSFIAGQGPSGSFVVSVSTTEPAAMSFGPGVQIALSSAGLLNEPSPAVDQVALVAAPPMVPASVAVVPAQIVIGTPASTEAGVNRVIVTSLKVPEQMPPVSVIVQRNTL